MVDDLCRAGVPEIVQPGDRDIDVILLPVEVRRDDYPFPGRVEGIVVGVRSAVQPSEDDRLLNPVRAVNAHVVALKLPGSKRIGTEKTIDHILNPVVNGHCGDFARFSAVRVCHSYLLKLTLCC